MQRLLFIFDRKNDVVGSLNSEGDLSKISTYFDDEYIQDLGTGAETFKFSTLADIDESEHLVVGNSVGFKEDGEFKLFNIIQIEEIHEENFIKTIYCEMASIELINEIVRPMKVQNASLRKFMTTILESTEWEIGRMDASFTEVHDFEIKDYKSVYELIQEYAVGTYGAEISYRVEIAHGNITGKYIDLYTERGNSDGFRFAYGSNLTSVTKTVDMSNLATALIAVGKNGTTIKTVDTPDKPLNQDFIEHKDAFERWNVNGSHIFGVHKEDTDSPQELYRLTKKALDSRAEPQIKYEMKVELLDREVKIGDTVFVIDHEFNPPLYLSARVNQLKTSKTDPYNDEVVLANFKEVKSNITSEMRQLASQLEGYVDSQFPIGGDKIQDGAIGKEQFSKQYHTEIISDAVYASLVETEDLIAGKADIGDLEAVNGKIENLESENVEITGKLTATDAEIKNLKAENVEINGSLIAQSASIKDLYANKIDVSELNAVNAKIESLQAHKADIDELNATKAEIVELVAKKADIDELNALYGKIEVLESNKANISDLNATNAQIDWLKANKADIVELDAIKGNITQLESEVAKIGVLESEVADIDELLAGNLTAENIATGAITAGSGIIANGAIGNAQISSLDASKISAGTVDTSKVTIQGADGHLRLKGNRLQVFQGVGNQAVERVSVGDVNGNGSVYGLRVRGADGQTVLLDENGVKSEGITNGAITNDKISEDANIDGAKLNINSVVTKINEDGTETIQGTKIEVDGTTLNTKLSTITTKQTEDSERISQAQSQITANTDAIKLKVDEQTYTTDKKDMTSKLEKNTSEISTMKGQIALKVEQSDIENAISEVEGTIDTKIDSAKAEIKVTTDKISQNVTNLSQTVSTKADGSTVTAINNKVGALETSINGISGKVTNLEKTTTTLGENVEGVKGEVSTLKSDVASLEVTTSGISQKVSSVESTTKTLTTQVGTAQDTANQAKADASSANSNATNALNKANSANTLADSKAKVFTSQPTVPYKVGDLWVQGTTGDVMKCKTARTTGSYTASDWEKASKYTDDTKANAVEGKVTTLEGKVSSTSSKVAEITTNLEGITQRVSSTESTTATLTKKVNTVEGTANTAKNTADSANSKIDGLEIGVRNIIENSNFSNGMSNWTFDGATGSVNNDDATYKSYLRISSISDSDSRVYYNPNKFKWTINKTFTISLMVKANKNTSISIGSYTDRKSYSVTTSWNKIVRTFTSDANSAFSIFTNEPGVFVDITNIQVEEGNKASSWSPAPEDIDSAIDTVTQEITKTNSKVSSIETNLSSITSRVSDVENTQTTVDEKVTSLQTKMQSAEQKLTKEGLTTIIGKHYTTSTDVDGIVTSKGYQTQSQVQQTVNGLEAKFTSSGGYNLLYNGDFKNGVDKWSGSTSNFFASTNVGYSCPNKHAVVNTGKIGTVYQIYQSVNIDGGLDKLTFSCWMYRSSESDGTTNPYTNIQLVVTYTDDTKTYITIPSKKYGTWEKVTQTISRTTSKVFKSVSVEIINRDTTRKIYVSQCMLEKGAIATEYTPNPNEIYDGITSIDKDGITVTASNVKSKTSMSANGFKITKTDTNEDVFKVNADGTLTLKGRMTITGGSVPTSSLDGTISSSQLNSSITTDINNAKNNASSALSTANTAKSTADTAKNTADSAKNTATNAQSTADTAKSTADSAKSTATTASTNATNALNTANAVNKVVNDNKVNWSDAYNRVKEWAYGAVTGSTTINGGLLQTNTVTAEKIAIGDFTNYVADPNFENGIYSNTGSWSIVTTQKHSGTKSLKLGAGATNNTVFALSRKISVRNGDKIYVEWWGYRDGANQPANINLNVSNADGTNNVYDISGNISMQATATNAKWIKYSYVGTVATDGFAIVQAKLRTGNTLTGNWYFDDILVKKMSSGELIVDGAITAGKIATNAITASKIASNAITAEKLHANAINGKTITGANLRGGTFFTAPASGETDGHAFRIYSDGRVYSKQIIQVYGAKADGDYSQLAPDRVTSTGYVQCSAYKTDNKTMYWAVDGGAVVNPEGDNTKRIKLTRTSENYTYFAPDYPSTNATNGIRLGTQKYMWNIGYIKNGVSSSSDRTLKENIHYMSEEMPNTRAIDNSDNIIREKDLYNFVKDDLYMAQFNFIGNDETTIGFIAQDLLYNEDGSDNKIGQLIVNKPDSEQAPLTYNEKTYVNVLAGALKQAILKIEELEKRLGEI